MTELSIKRRSCFVSGFMLSTGLLILAGLSLAGCSSHVKAPASGLSQVGGDGARVPELPSPSNAGPGEKFNPEEDEIICRGTRTAFKRAVSHDEKGSMSDAEWKKVRQQDEEESMKMLQDLSLRFKTSSFIKTMMGQVKQHFGKHEEAAEYYEEATLQNRRDPIMFFKAAEMRRKSGNTQKALAYYQKVVDIRPDFPGAKLGMARCLLADKKTAEEGRRLLQEIVSADPQDKEARQVLDESKAK